MTSNPKKRSFRKKLAEEANAILVRRSADAYEKAKEIMLSEKIKTNSVREAMCYFMQEWQDIQHPGLLSLSCEAAGGNPNNATDIGAALVLLLSGAHIHDDIIDQSRSKGHKPTIYGRFGRDIALLVGDAFLFEGLTLLHKFCEKFPENKKRAIINSIKAAFFEIGSGEAKEVTFRKKSYLSPKVCVDYLRMRAAVAEVVMRIGAIIGNGSKMEIELLSHYGRTLGLLTAIRDEFVDIFEPEELENRYKHECLPLPVLYAVQNPQKKEEIIRLLKKKRITERDSYTLADLVIETEEVQKLKKKMHLIVDRQLRQLKALKLQREILAILIRATIEDL